MYTGFNFATINNDGDVEVRFEMRNGNHQNKVIKNEEDFNNMIKFMAEHQLYTRITCSSSLDFPEEYTDKPETFAICNLFRG